MNTAEPAKWVVDDTGALWFYGSAWSDVYTRLPDYCTSKTPEALGGTPLPDELGLLLANLIDKVRFLEEGPQ